MEGTCATERSQAIGEGEIMLFGVRVVVDSMRKCVSLNDLSQYGEPQDLMPRKKKKKMKKDESRGIVYEKSETKEDIVAAAYASADDAVRCYLGGNRLRKRGIPWTEEEHKLFLIGLQKVGKGDWRGISRNFVKTRTPTQVASHAQKYYLRHNNLNSSRRRRRSSLFDIPTDLVIENLTQNPTIAQTTNKTNPVHSIPEAAQSATISDLKLSSKPAMNQSQVSLNLSLSLNQKFQVGTDFSCGDNNSSVISVA